MSLSCTSGRLVTALAVYALAWLPHAFAASPLRKLQVPAPVTQPEVRLDIGDLIMSGAVQPRAAISINEAKEKC